MEKSEQIKKFIELRSEGYSLRDISKVIGKSPVTLVKWNKKYCTVVFEVQKGELNAFKQKILEEKKSRLEYLNHNYSKLKEKIEDSEIIMRYDKMLALLMKISKSIDDCQKNIVLSEISGDIDDVKVSGNTVKVFNDKNSPNDEKKVEMRKENA
jgi:hypothetical protein